MIFFVQQILKLGTRGFFLAELEKFVFGRVKANSGCDGR